MKILDFGSLNVDYVYSVDHFVRPGETLSSQKREVFCGGKGLNQSIALARAGARVYHAGKIGSDGSMLLDTLKKDGVDVTHVGISDGPSGHAIIQVNAGGQNCIILFGGSNMEIDEAFVDAVLADFGAGDLCLLQNEISSLPYVMEQAHAKGIRIAINPSPMDANLLACPLHLVEFFIMNELEGKEITGCAAPGDIIAAMREKYPESKAVLTLGKDGVVYFDGEQTYTHGIYDVPVVDTTAAGDTFTGYFLASISAGVDAAEALRLASVASSIAVSRKGASPSIPAADEVRAADLPLDPRFK